MTDPLEVKGVGAFITYLWGKFPERDVSPISFKWSRRPVHEFEVATEKGTTCVIEVASRFLYRSAEEMRMVLDEWDLVGAINRHRRLLVTEAGVSPRPN